MYKKLTKYSFLALWFSAICSIVFVCTFMNADNSMFSFLSPKEDTSNYAFYNKKLLSRNEKNITQEIPEAELEVSKEAIKSSMLRQSVKLKSVTNLETTKPIIKEKPVLKQKSNDGFEIKPLPKN
jgi:hypothetical protein